MTQELNKDGLEAACAARINAQSSNPDISVYDLVKETIRAYLSHPKVTGFDAEELAKNLCVWMYNVNYIDISESQLEEARRTVTLLGRMGYLREEAALAGGGHD